MKKSRAKNKDISQIKEILIFSLGILIVAVIISGGWLALTNFGLGVAISTDKAEYQKTENLKVNIRNNSAKNICFSSCYPYYLKKKVRATASLYKEWATYSYGECPKDDINENCVKSGQLKAFEIPLSKTQNGIHRITIPVCQNCKLGDSFKENQKFYSNEFIIK